MARPAHVTGEVTWPDCGVSDLFRARFVFVLECARTVAAGHFFDPTDGFVAGKCADKVVTAIKGGGRHRHRLN